MRRNKAKTATLTPGKTPAIAWVTPLAIVAFLMTALAALADGHVTKSHGIPTFGELKYPADYPHLDYVNPDAPKGGEMSFAWIGSFDSMHPYTTKGRAGLLSSSLFESLLEGTADEIGSSYGLIAESMEYPEDRGWVIFNMRDDVTFSDGSPLTAHDVIFSYELFRDKGLPSFRAVLTTQVESGEVIDDYTVKYTFKEGVPWRDLPATVGGLPIFSKAHYEANDRDFEATSLEPLLGSGAYTLSEMDVGKTLVYARNPDYWGNDHPLRVGHNNFDSLRIEYYGDSNAAFEGFKAGSYTFRNENSSKSWATSYDFPAIEKGWVIQNPLPDGSIASGQSFIFNLRRPQFQDPRVREAIGLMFNFEWSNETLFYGLYDRITSFWENTDLKATGKAEGAELALLETVADLLPPGVIDGEVVVPYVSGERQLDRKALRQASALLDEAGWEVGDDGMRRNADGEMLKVEFLNDSQAFDRIINPFVENLRRLGVDAVHNRVDNAQATLREREKDFDVVTDHFPMSYIPGAGLRQYFGSETAETSLFNGPGVSDPAVDKLIEAIEAAENPTELEPAVRALDRVLRAQQFWVPQWFKAVHTVAYFDMYEYPEPLPPYALGNLSFWWLNQEKAGELKAAGAF